MPKILVTGGAGYIGSIAVKALLEEGHEVVVIDNLSNGRHELVNKNATFYRLDLTDKEKLEAVFKNNKIDAVIHFAGYKSVDESMINPIKYSDNITGTINLLNQMVAHNVKKIIFSSSSSVYGNTKYSPVDEEHPTEPISFYGYTKLQIEKILGWYSKAYDISYTALRYFNVAGDGGLKYVDPNAKNVFPILMHALLENKEFTIFGTDYDTPDGTCVRDYIDVRDLVRAHVLALNAEGNHIINLGSSQGYSVKEIVEKTIQVTGKKLKYSYGPRRPGDPASVVASNAKAKLVLGWTPKYDVADMIKTTYETYNK